MKAARAAARDRTTTVTTNPVVIMRAELAPYGTSELIRHPSLLVAEIRPQKPVFEFF